MSPADKEDQCLTPAPPDVGDAAKMVGAPSGCIEIVVVPQMVCVYLASPKHIRDETASRTIC